MADEPSDSLPVDPAEPVAPADPPDPAPFEAITSQEQFDRMVKNRLDRQRQQFAGYEELKAKAAKLDGLEAANKTALEKAQERADQAEKAAQTIKDTANSRLVEAAVLSEATRQKAVRPEHLHKLIDTGQVTVGDDGQVTGVEEAVQTFLTANPEYVGTRPQGSADQGARGKADGNSQVTAEQLSRMSPEEVLKADREGRLTALTTGS